MYSEMGYDLERFVGPVNEGLLCCICRDVLEEPLQSPCEHSFCTACIQGWLVHENTCPEDRQLLLASMLKPIHRYMKNDLAKLQVRCKNTDAGCTLVTNLEFVLAHQTDCGYHTIECTSPGCTVKLERRKLEDHLKDCDYRMKECPQGCGLPILSTDDKKHNCIAELRHTVELLRSEMICKMDDQKQDTETRLDAQRCHMVVKESGLQSQIDDLHAHLSRQTTELRILQEIERQRRIEMDKIELEKKELLGLVKSMREEMSETFEAMKTQTLPGKTKQHMCIQCNKKEKITVI